MAQTIHQQWQLRGLDTEGKWGNVKKEQVLGLLGGVSRKNGGMDSGAIGNSLIEVDTFVGLLVIEKVGHKLAIRRIQVEPPARMVSLETTDLQGTTRRTEASIDCGCGWQRKRLSTDHMY